MSVRQMTWGDEKLKEERGVKGRVRVLRNAQAHGPTRISDHRASVHNIPRTSSHLK
jgi:hypothetical protein